MNHKTLNQNNQEEITCLFTSVFTSSEGEKEGRLIGNLVSKLSAGIDSQNIICFGTYRKKSIIGSIFFTRLQFKRAIQIYMLSPVAVSTEHQGKGIGQALIIHGLNELRNHSVTVVVTYGDPSFYSKIGFQSLSEKVISAPMKLSMPEGWLGQSLTNEPIPNIRDRPKCIKEFKDPIYW